MFWKPATGPSWIPSSFNPRRCAMLWEVDILPKRHEGEIDRVREEYDLLTHGQRGQDLIVASSRGYLLDGPLDEVHLQTLLETLLVDPLVEHVQSGELNFSQNGADGEIKVTVLLKPGVMDAVAQSVVDAARDLGIPLESVRTFRRYALNPRLLNDSDREILFRKVLSNEAIEQAIEGPLHLDHLTLGSTYTFRLITVPLRQTDDAGLVEISRSGQLSLNLAEMKAIQEHFRTLGRDPTDVKLETVAQTWSEHC